MERKHHGGEDRSGRILYDFSVNINPLGMPETAKTALLSGWDAFENYPDDACAALREALGARFGMDSRRIVCGNGASDLIYRLCLCAGWRRVLLPVPAFTEYERALTAAGCEIVPLFTEEGGSFILEEKHVLQITESFDALFLCNPGNPSGGLMEKPLVEKVISRCEEQGVCLVIDECFLDFVRDGKVHSAVQAAADGKKVVVVRAFTKIFAMAGLRLGFALFGDADLARKVMEFGAPWQVSGPAQAAGLAVLGWTGKRYEAEAEERGLRERWNKTGTETERCGSAEQLHMEEFAILDEAEAERMGKADFFCGEGGCCQDSGIDEAAAFIESTAAYVEGERRVLEEGLLSFGFPVVRGCANFILFRAPANLDKLLAEQGFSIRNCSDYAGLRAVGERSRSKVCGGAGEEKCTAYYRIAVRKGFENRLLLAAMRRCIEWL